MKMRRLISAIIALLLVVNLSVTAFAAEWYLEDGDITVSAGDSGQTVSQWCSAHGISASTYYTMIQAWITRKLLRQATQKW